MIFGSAADRDLRNKRKKFEADVSAALAAFAKAKEWADLVDCLRQLNRAVEKPAPDVVTIPFKDAVAKRLAQSLIHELPAGVHAQSLEIYGLIFNRIGKDGLCDDLALYSVGLFPFFRDCEPQNKNLFLDLIENYYLPLDDGLLPCLTGLLVCLLPGLERSEQECQRILELLGKLSDKVGEKNVMCALWVVILRTSRVRAPALAFLKGKLSPQLTQERIENLFPGRATLVLSALKAVLEDQNILARRAVLDLLVKHVPFSSNSSFTFEEKVPLLRACLVLLPARDPSLSRRVLEWLTNQSDIAGFLNIDYFKQHSQVALAEAIQSFTVTQPSTEVEAVRVIKILMNLVGEGKNEDMVSLIMPDVAVPVLQYVYRNMEGHAWSEQLVEEAQLLFNPPITKPDSVWNAVAKLYEEHLESERPEQCISALSLYLMYLDRLLPGKLSIVEDAVARQKLLEFTLKSFSRVAPSFEALTNIREVLAFGVGVLAQIQNLYRLSPDQHYQAGGEGPGGDSESVEGTEDGMRHLEAIRLFHPTLTNGELTFDQASDLTEAERGLNLAIEELKGFFEAVLREMDSMQLAESALADQLITYELLSRTFVDLLKLQHQVAAFNHNSEGVHRLSSSHAASIESSPSPAMVTTRHIDESESVPRPEDVDAGKSIMSGNTRERLPPPWLQAVYQGCKDERTRVSCRVAQTFVDLLKNDSLDTRYIVVSTRHCDEVARHLWKSLDDEGFYSEVVHLILELHHVCEPLRQNIVHDVISPDLGFSSSRLQAVNRFAELWRYSQIQRPRQEVFPGAMKLVLDCLEAADPDTRHAARSWLASAMENLPSVLDPVVEDLFLVENKRKRLRGSTRLEYLSKEQDLPRALYCFAKLTSIMQAEQQLFIEYMQKNDVGKKVLTLWREQVYDEGTAGAATGGTTRSPAPAEGNEAPSGQQSRRTSSKNPIAAPSSGPPSGALTRRGSQTSANAVEGYDHALCVKDYLDLCCSTALRFIQSQCVPHAYEPAETQLSLVRQNSAVRSAALEFLKSLLNNCNPASRAKELSSFLLKSVTDILSNVIEDDDSGLQVQLLGLLRIIILKVGTGTDPQTSKTSIREVPNYAPGFPRTTAERGAISRMGSRTDSPAARTADSMGNLMGHANEGTGDHGEWEARNDRARASMLAENAEWRKMIDEAIDVKAQQRGRIRSSESMSKLLDVLFKGLDTHERHAAVHVNPLPHYVAFLNFTTRFVPPQSAVQTCDRILSSFCQRIMNLDKHHSIGVLHFFNGLIGISEYVFEEVETDTANQQQETSDTWTFGGMFGLASDNSNVQAPTQKERTLISSLPKVISASCKATFFLTFQPSQGLTPGGTVSTEVGGRSGPSSAVLADAPINAAVYRQRSMMSRQLSEGSVGARVASSASVDIDKKPELSKRRYRKVLQRKVAELLSKLLKRYPKDFIRACLSVASDSVVELEGRKKIIAPLLWILTHVSRVSPKHLCDLICDVVDDTLKTYQPPREASPFYFRESVILDFVHSLLAQSSLESDDIWLPIFRLLAICISHLKQPIGFLWVFSILLLVDSKRPAKEGTMTKKIKADLAALLSSVVNASTRQLGNRLSGVPARQNVDLQSPLPPACEIVSAALRIGPAHMADISGISDSVEVWREVSLNIARRGRPGVLGINLADGVSGWKPTKDLQPSKDTSIDTVLYTDPVDVVAHFALSCILMFCTELNAGNRGTPLLTMCLEVICDAMPNELLPFMHNRAVENVQYRFLLMSVVDQLPYRLYEPCVAAVKKSIMKLLLAENFFEMLDRRTLRCFTKVVEICVRNDFQKLDALVPPPNSGIFVSRERDAINRSKHLKQISFVIYSCPVDTFHSQLPAIMHRLLDSTRTTEVDALRIQVLFCMRILLLKISPQHLTPVWPLVLSELINIFQSASAENIPKSSRPSEALVLSALKVVDLASLLDLPDFHVYQWMFVSETIKRLFPDSASSASSTQLANPSDKKGPQDEKGFRPFSSRIVSALCEDGGSRRPSRRVSGGSVSRMAAGVRRGSSTFRRGGGKGRRPLVTARRVQDTEALCDAAEELDSGFAVETFCKQEVDSQAVMRSVEGDFLESPEVLLDWGKPLACHDLFKCLATHYRCPLKIGYAPTVD